jgi:hypothetical protein
VEAATGNLIMGDIGDGQFAHYYHLQPGSLQVKPGDKVASGQQAWGWYTRLNRAARLVSLSLYRKTGR